MSLATGSFIIASRRVVPATPGRGRTLGTAETSTVSVSSNPAQHRSEHLAKKEAERLATVEPGTEFVVLEVKGTVVSSATVWK